jgi:hypothetical protein
MLFTLAAIIVTLCFMMAIRKLSVNPAVSVFVLLTSGSLFYSFNGLRQGLAMAIYFLAIGAIYQRRFWVFLVCVAAACFFHYSAVMVLPTYFMVPRKNDVRYNVFIFVLTLISFLSFSKLINLAGQVNPKYSAYGMVVEGGRGLVYASSLLAVGGFFLYFKSHIQQHRSLYDFLLNLYLLGLAVITLCVLTQTSASGIMRESGYLTSSQILLWPIVFVNVRQRLNRHSLLAAFALLSSVYYGMTLRAFSHLVPYTLNPLVRGFFSSLF